MPPSTCLFGPRQSLAKSLEPSFMRRVVLLLPDAVRNDESGMFTERTTVGVWFLVVWLGPPTHASSV